MVTLTAAQKKQLADISETIAGARRTLGLEDLPMSTQTPSTRDVMLESGDPASMMDLGRSQASQIGDSSAYQKFGTALMEMMKNYQGMGTRKFQEAELGGREAQAERIMQTPENLIGAHPSIQAGAREAHAGALQPQISGARELGQTFSEQLSSFGNALNQAGAIGSWMHGIEQEEKREAQKIVMNYPDAVKSMDEKERRDFLKRAGIDEAFLDTLLERTSPEPPQVFGGQDTGYFTWVQDESGNWTTKQVAGPGQSRTGTTDKIAEERTMLEYINQNKGKYSNEEIKNSLLSGSQHHSAAEIDKLLGQEIKQISLTAIQQAVEALSVGEKLSILRGNYGDEDLKSRAKSAGYDLKNVQDMDNAFWGSKAAASLISEIYKKRYKDAGFTIDGAKSSGGGLLESIFRTFTRQ
jgi:hypothetical protein